MVRVKYVGMLGQMNLPIVRLIGAYSWYNTSVL